MSGVAIVTYNRVVSLLGAPTATIALLPAVSSILAIPILGEDPTPIESLAIMVIGVLLAANPAAANRRWPITKT